MLTPTPSQQSGTTHSPASAIALHPRAHVPWRPLIAAVLLAVALGVTLTGVLAKRHSAVAPGVPHRGLSSLPLAAQGQISATLGVDQRAYRVSRTTDGFAASNPGQRLHAGFGRSGVMISSRTTAFGLGLRAVGYGSSLTPVGTVTPTAKANRVSYVHAGVTEWYANGPLGVEQGFVIPRAPAGHQTAPLTLAIALSGNTRATIARDGGSLTLGHPGGHSLRYGGLTANDARGHALHSWLALHNGRLLLRVDTRDARYPLRIDPFIQQSGNLIDGDAYENVTVALSGDGNTALIGVPSPVGEPCCNGLGAAFVFTRSGTTWTQQGEELRGSGEVGGEFGGANFGGSVALSSDGNTALIGGLGDNAGTGAAWVFTRSGEEWTQQGEKLTGAGEVGTGDFGSSVALSSDGNTALIGGAGDNTNVGAAWVFTRSGTTWTQEGQKLTGIGESGSGAFGNRVALSSDGSTALIGGFRDNNSVGAAWVFTHSGEAWTQQAPKFTPAGEAWFGFSVALSSDGNAALVGGPNDNGGLGAAWVFARSDSVWAQQGEKLTGGGESGTGKFGNSVAVSSDGNTALIGGPEDAGMAGAAWALTRSGATWHQYEKFTLAGQEGVSLFGTNVALSSDGGTALISTYKLPKQNGASEGAAYVLVNNHAAPSVTGVAPSAGPPSGGTTVTITGANFSPATAVYFGATAARSFKVNSKTFITAVSPAGAGVVDVRVTSPDGTSATGPSDRFSYEPTVTAVKPASGPKLGGTTVTISGSNLLEATTVSFGPTSATSFTVNSSTSITATSPPGTGTVDVTVTTAGGTSAPSPSDQFTYLEAPEYGRCVRVGKGVGLYGNGSCTTPGGERNYEWYPAFGGRPLVKSHFTTKIKELTEAKLLIAGKHVISCTGETGSGEYSGPKTIANVAITLTGCHLNEVGSCQSLEAEPGEVVLSTLEGELGVIKTSAEGPLKNLIGTDLKPISGEVVAAFACGGTPVLVTGSVIAKVAKNAMKLQPTLTFAASAKGIQNPTGFEGIEEDVLRTKLGEGGAFEQTGLKLTMVQTNEEKVEVNSVF